jgi:Cu(I)/Ag(I) efflux system membrane fusion protein
MSTPPSLDPPSVPPEAAGAPGALTSRPARRFGLLTLLLVAAISAAGAGGTAYLVAARAHRASSATSAEKTLYQCPMHPTIVRDHPGECPICGMKLVEMNTAGGPVYADEVGANGASSVVGLATVDIDPARQQLIGLETASVTRGSVSGTFRTIGRVAVDETRVRHVSIKVPVYVKRVYANFVGKRVKRGAPLFSGYSPELLAAQEQYRLALSTQKSLSGSSSFSVDSSGLVTAARRKLELWDVPKSAIERLEQKGEPMKTLTFHSPIAGVIMKKDVVDGMKLDEGAMPYEIVDLSRVWVLADIYETDLHRVHVGMAAKLTLKAYPNRVFEGKAAFVDPMLDPKTRTVKLRLEFPNPDGDLKPELFGEVVLESRAREALRVPEDAVIDSGKRKVVFVALDAGKFQPREVTVGDSDGVNVEIVSGLSEGDKVVVRANFLVDSESRLRASLAALSTAAPRASAVPAISAAKANPPATTTSAKPKSEKAAPPPAYACPMHPEVTDVKPSRCPKCGMVLTPVHQKHE